MRDNSQADLQWGTVGVTISKSVLVALLALLIAVGLTVGATGALASSSGDDEYASEDDPYDQLIVTADCDEKNGSVLEIQNPNDEAASVAIAWESDDPSLSVQSDGQISTQVQTSSQATASGTETVQTLTATVPGDETVAITGLQDGTYDLSATIDETEVGIAYDEAHDSDKDDTDKDVVFDRTDEGHVELTLECDATDKSAPIFMTVVDEDHDDTAAVDVATTDDKHEDKTADDALETAKAITDSLFETDETDDKKDGTDEHDDSDEKKDEKGEHDDSDEKKDEKGEHDDSDEKKDEKGEHDDRDGKDEKDDEKGDGDTDKNDDTKN